MKKIAQFIATATLLCMSVAAFAAAVGRTSIRTARQGATDIDQRVEKVLAQMTLDEKLDYISGLEGPKGQNMYIRPVPRVGLPGFKMSDGPLGVRTWGPSMGYPAGISMAASWDTVLEHRVGVEMGKDALARGVDFILGPGVNIYRAPMCGRNFEYFGEDPFLASRMAVAVIEGIQSQGVSATVKHFVANNQEYDRHNVSSDVDERTLREIYLPAFEAAVKEAHVGAVMDSYNLVNGVHMTQNAPFMIDLVKKEWGFPGIIMSDWDATYDGVAAANAGLDLEMPYGKFMTRANLMPAIHQGQLSVAKIDDKVRRILRTAMRFGLIQRAEQMPTESLMNEEGRSVALEASLGGMVLLKNTGILPLDKSKLKTIAVIGPRAWPGVPEGGGSSHVDPLVSVSFLEGISNRLFGAGIRVLYAPGEPKAMDIYNSTEFSTSEDGKNPGLAGEYFDDPDLQGTPALKRTDEHINFSFGHGTYRPGGPTRDYSARWAGYYIPTASGEYTFYAGGHNGFRLYVDDKLVMDEWQVEDTGLQLVSMNLEAGKPYKIRLEYTARRGSASMGLGITSRESAEVKQARETAAKADAVILCVGFDMNTEGEGHDRTFALPGGQDELIRAVEAANKNVVIVLTAGGNVDMTKWIDAAPALIHAWYPGEEGGTALAKIVFGDVSPSGKLPASCERRWQDNATYNSYYAKDDMKHVAYTEGVFLGYRHFDKSDVKPLFPFGFGLSYTTFKYGNLRITPASFSGVEPVTVSFDVTNTGKREGAEVGEVYVSDGHSKVERPVKELKGFGKVDLRPGETKTVMVKLYRRAFSYYDVNQKSWVATPGSFGILVGSSSEKIELKGNVTLSR
jgi:beta-glucosidase